MSYVDGATAATSRRLAVADSSSSVLFLNGPLESTPLGEFVSFERLRLGEVVEISPSGIER